MRYGALRCHAVLSSVPCDGAVPGGAPHKPHHNISVVNEPLGSLIYFWFREFYCIIVGDYMT